jgi:hypothetical protein
MPGARNKAGRSASRSSGNDKIHLKAAQVDHLDIARSRGTSRPHFISLFAAQRIAFLSLPVPHLTKTRTRTAPMARKLGFDKLEDFAPYDFKAANEDYAANVFKRENMVVGARSRAGIITCCDARCSPDQFFRFGENEAFVIRNGG